MPLVRSGHRHVDRRHRNPVPGDRAGLTHLDTNYVTRPQFQLQRNTKDQRRRRERPTSTDAPEASRASTAPVSVGTTVAELALTRLPVPPSTVTKLPPGSPFRSPSSSRPDVSRRPRGGCPLTRTWRGCESRNGAAGVKVTVDRVPSESERICSR